jgi:hypothetical protein
MPTPTYIALANLTLGSAQTSVSFSSIPGSYRDLVLIFYGSATSSQANDYLYFNGDTTQSNYSYARIQWDGTGVASAAASDSTVSDITSGSPNTVIMNLMDYSATDKHKNRIVKSTNVNGTSLVYNSRWANTAAITSLTYDSASGGQFASGSTFALYGIAS